MEIAQTFTGLVRVGVKIPQDGNRTNVYVHVTVLSSTSYEGMILLCYIIYICILCVSLFNLFISDRCCIGIFCFLFLLLESFSPFICFLVSVLSRFIHYLLSYLSWCVHVILPLSVFE